MESALMACARSIEQAARGNEAKFYASRLQRHDAASKRWDTAHVHYQELDRRWGILASHEFMQRKVALKELQEATEDTLDCGVEVESHQARRIAYLLLIRHKLNQRDLAADWAFRALKMSPPNSKRVSKARVAAALGISRQALFTAESEQRLRKAHDQLEKALKEVTPVPVGGGDSQRDRGALQKAVLREAALLVLVPDPVRKLVATGQQWRARRDSNPRPVA